MEQPIARFSLKTNVYYGPGSSGLVGSQAHKAGLKKALIVTDPGVYQAGLTHPVAESLQAQGIGCDTFHEVPEDADVAVIGRISARLRQSGCDGLVVVGGGSPICATKGAALEAANPGLDIRAMEGRNCFKSLPLPVICLPTTAGSGSDVSEGFPVVDRERKRHFAVSGEGAAPAVSLLDPLLLKTLPYWPKVYAEIDALSHALEALWSKNATPLTDALACEAIRLILTNVQAATFTDDLAAKTNQHLGSTLGMIAASFARLGLVHAISGLVFSVQGAHGYKCGVFLPLALEYNLPACREKYARMEVMLGDGTAPENPSELARRFIRRVKQTLLELEFPTRLEGPGASPENIPAMIQEIRGNTPSFLDFNLRPISDADLRNILERALKGWNPG